MRLNLDILSAWLPKQWTMRRFGGEKQGLVLSRPRIYEPGVLFAADNLYLVRAEMLPETPPDTNCSLLCLGRRLPKAWANSTAAVLQISDAVGLAEVYNRVQEIYDAFDVWDDQLRDELEKYNDFDIRKCLLLAAEFFHRMVNVVDSNLQNIFSVCCGERGNAQILEKTGPMPMEHSEKIKEVCTLERVIREPYQTALDILGRAYCCNLYISDQFCGCVSINEGEQHFAPWEFPVMAHFFSYFQKAYFKYLRANSHQESAGLSALRNALNNRSMTAEEQQALALRPEEQWLCFALRERKNERALPEDYMAATLSAAFPQKIYAVIHHERIVGLIRVETKDPYAETSLAPFSETVRRMGYDAGVSNAFSDASQIRDYLRQAAYVLERGENATPLRFFRDCTLDYMLDSCLGEQPVEALLTRGLKNLIDQDRQKGTTCLQTLELYLRNEMSVSRTAEQLFIHRSSLLKRLEKIYRLLGSRLETPEQRLYLRLCLALLDKTQKQP